MTCVCLPSPFRIPLLSTQLVANVVGIVFFRFVVVEERDDVQKVCRAVTSTLCVHNGF